MQDATIRSVSPEEARAAIRPLLNVIDGRCEDCSTPETCASFERCIRKTEPSDTRS